MGKLFDFINLGFAIVNASTTIVAMVRAHQLMAAPLVWETIQPVLADLQTVAGIKINMVLAQKITTDAVDTIKAALTPKVA